MFALTISTVYTVAAFIFTMTTAQSALCVCQEMPGLNNGLVMHVWCFLGRERMGAKQGLSSLNAILNHCFGEGNNRFGEMQG